MAKSKYWHILKDQYKIKKNKKYKNKAYKLNPKIDHFLGNFLFIIIVALFLYGIGICLKGSLFYYNLKKCDTTVDAIVTEHNEYLSQGLRSFSDSYRIRYKFKPINFNNWFTHHDPIDGEDSYVNIVYNHKENVKKSNKIKIKYYGKNPKINIPIQATIGNKHLFPIFGIFLIILLMSFVYGVYKSKNKK